jgi:hypothetical protein
MSDEIQKKADVTSSETRAQLSKLAADASTDAKLKQRLLEQPGSVLKEYGIQVSATTRELSNEDLANAVGGMKVNLTSASPNVIDARGGQFTLFGLNYSFDVNGHISDIS